MNMMTYPTHSSWCEVAHSQLLKENDEVKQKSTKDPLLYVTKKVDGQPKEEKAQPDAQPEAQPDAQPEAQPDAHTEAHHEGNKAKGF